MAEIWGHCSVFLCNCALRNGGAAGLREVCDAGSRGGAETSSVLLSRDKSSTLADWTLTCIPPAPPHPSGGAGFNDMQGERSLMMGWREGVVGAGLNADHCCFSVV